VVGVNDAPVATDNAYTVDENTVLSGRNVITDPVPDSDPDSGDTRSVSAVNGVSGNVGQPFTTANGARVTINSNGALSYNPTVSATLNALTTGSPPVVDTFTYTIVDSRGATSTATVTVTVTGVNDPPGLLNDDFTVNQNTTTTLDVLANDSDPEGPLDPASLIVVAGFGPTKGTATVVNGKVQYTPNASVTGADSFRYQVADSLGATSIATVTLTIRQTPSAWQNPIKPLDVNGDTFVTPIDALLVINLLNSAGAGPLAGRTPPIPVQPFVDTNGDSSLTALDALLVINAINAGAGEGEGREKLDGSWESYVSAPEGGEIAYGSAVLIDHRWGPDAAQRGLSDTARGTAVVAEPLGTTADDWFAVVGAEASPAVNPSTTLQPTAIVDGGLAGDGSAASDRADWWGDAIDKTLADGI
jgi:VCBS repeat-containing protein